MHTVLANGKHNIYSDIPFVHIAKYLEQLAIARFGESQIIVGRNKKIILPNNTFIVPYITHIRAFHNHQQEYIGIRTFLKILIVREILAWVLTGECDFKLLERLTKSDNFLSWTFHPNTPRLLH